MTTIVPRITASQGKAPWQTSGNGNDNLRSAFAKNLDHDVFYSVNRLTIPALSTLPLQTTPDHSRHVTVLAGIVHITMGQEIFALTADESLYLPQGILHGFENRADQPAIVISIDYKG